MIKKRLHRGYAYSKLTKLNSIKRNTKADATFPKRTPHPLSSFMDMKTGNLDKKTGRHVLDRKTRRHVFMSKKSCLHVCMSKKSCLHVCMSKKTCLHVFMSKKHVCMSKFMYACLRTKKAVAYSLRSATAFLLSIALRLAACRAMFRS